MHNRVGAGRGLWIPVETRMAGRGRDIAREGEGGCISKGHWIPVATRMAGRRRDQALRCDVEGGAETSHRGGGNFYHQRRLTAVSGATAWLFEPICEHRTISMRLAEREERRASLIAGATLAVAG